MKNRHRMFGLGCAATLLLTACGPQQAVEPSPEVVAAETSRGETAAVSDQPTLANGAVTNDAGTNDAVTPQATRDKLKFKRANGQEAFSIKFKPDGGKLVDAGDQELARFKTEANQSIRIKGSNDEALGYVTSQAGAWSVVSADQSQVFFVLRSQAAGDYLLEDGNGSSLYRIQAREDGYKIGYPKTAQASPEPMYRVKVKPGKVSLRNAAGETILSTKGDMLPVAIAAFALDSLSLEQQAALAFALNAG